MVNNCDEEWNRLSDGEETAQLWVKGQIPHAVRKEREKGGIPA